MMLSAAAQQLLAAQKHKYLSSLDEKKDRIDDIWHTIQTKGWTKARSAELKMQVHRLSGSAGSYGLKNLGEKAQRLDRLLGGKADRAERAARTEGLMNDLIAALDSAIIDQRNGS